MPNAPPTLGVIRRSISFGILSTASASGSRTKCGPCVAVYRVEWPTVSEMAFLEGAMMVFQLQLTKRQDVVPMTRDYIAREEARLRALEGGGRLPLRLAGE